MKGYVIKGYARKGHVMKGHAMKEYARKGRASRGIFCILLASAWLPLKSFANLPVIDVGAIANLIKNYEQLQSQYRLLTQTYQNAKQQLDKVKQLANDAEGHYGLGGLMNSAEDLKNRQWSPNDWQGALQGLSGGNPARYQELLHTYQQNHPTLSESAYKKGASLDNAKVYAQDVQVNRAAMVNASYAFNNIKTHLSTLHQLSQKIDETQNTKAALDLNSRLIAEGAYIQTQELKMQILLNQQMAQANADGIAAKTASAKFNTLPE